MPFALLIIGAVLVVAAIRNTQGDLFTLVSGDFSGPSNFIFWMVAILLIGSIGYIPKIKPLSVAFLSLVVLVLFLAKGDPSKATGGFFEKFTAGLQTTTTAAGAAAAPATTVIGPNSNALPPVKINLPDLPTISNLVN
jgi:hypothetical protein